MPYSDEAYLAARRKLSSAIYTLVENEISKEDIQEMVDQALEEAFEEDEVDAG